MLSILATVAPVFLLIAIGYVAVRSGYLPDGLAEALNQFAARLAVPVLLFSAIGRLDLGEAFAAPVLIGFYAGAFTCFVIGIVMARSVFKRRPGEAVAVGFAATFSNSLLLGVAIVERSHGAPSLTFAFGIIAVHAPLIYTVGILTMELMRRDGRTLPETLTVAGRSILANPLMIGILAGLALNLSGLTLPEPVTVAKDMLSRAAIPVALVGIGAGMTRYRLRANLPEAGMVAVLSLFLHPAIAFTLTHLVFDLPADAVRAAVTLAAMPPGVNIYLFATLYNRAIDLAATAFLLATMASVVTATLWLYVLERALGA
ncbi:AEC family transporter [Oricola sp.]|uniref:AEC family transporter n=1 Tax=Oricola sp. TaxID=1979950 RepID=UPI003BAB9E48